MDKYHVEAYRYLRDHAKPISQRDAADLAEVRAPQPPSKAHIHRLKRDRSLPFHERPVERKPLSEQARRGLRINDYYKRQMALLGGTRTVAPVYPEIYPRPESAWRYQPQARDVELYPEPKPFEFMTEEKACSIARDHLIALAKSNLEVDMFMVLRVFDDYAQFGEAVKNALR